MSVTIDASVFVAASRSEEIHYLVSRRFLETVRMQEQDVFCPILVLPECVAAIARATGNTAIANELVALIKEFPRMHLIVLDHPIVDRAVQVAGTYRLRGADSIYVAVAEEFGSQLVTWDSEMRQRGGDTVVVSTPAEWAAGS